MITENILGRPEFSSPRAFQRWSQKCRNSSGSLANYFFVGSYLTSNPPVARNSLTSSQNARNQFQESA